MPNLLSPRSIAVIGASATPGKVGHDILKNILTQGYKGEVYPVNPKGGEILGKKAFASLADIPGSVDLAVIVTPGATVAGLLEECGAKKVPHVIVISAGFGETGKPEGKAEEEKVRTLAKKHGISLIGVNCLGMLRPSLGLNASFAKDMPPAGSVALISQSGALAVAVMDKAPEIHLGFSLIISIGNKTSMDECDYLEICEADSETKVIGLYLESIKDGKRFRALCERITPKKPIVLIKSGVSEKGKSAVSSHTGALAGSDAAISALCTQTGVRRARTSQEFLDLLRTLSVQPALLSPHVVVITNAGGPGILATDAAEKCGLALPSLAPETEEDLSPQLPPAASVHNPVDVLGDAGADRYKAALECCAQDPHIDGICLLLTPQVMTPVTEIADAAGAIMRKFPLLPITACFMGGIGVTDGVAALAAHGIPSFETPERAMAALASLKPMPVHRGGTAPLDPLRRTKAQDLLKNRTGLLDEDLTRTLFELYALPLPAQDVAKSEEEAVAIAKRIGLPVVAKISSPDILHKTEMGGVRANLKTEADVREAYRAIAAATQEKAPQARVNGILIQRFLPVGNEFIVGGLQDAAFGPLVMTGLGGIYTELFRDTSFRLSPMTMEETYAMLHELNAWKLLLGMRGKPQSDIDALAAIILQVSFLLQECPQITELDLNPVLVDSAGAVIADAKVVLG
jgi:acetyl coenzyme A synthetase (ADP forming)-like protein